MSPTPQFTEDPELDWSAQCADLETPAARAELVREAFLTLALQRYWPQVELVTVLPPSFGWARLLIAAGLLLAVGFGFGFLISGGSAFSDPGGYRVLAGTVLVDGRQRPVQVDSELSVVGEEVARLRLPDGSLLIMQPQTRLALRRPAAGERQALELLRGEVRCQVSSDDELFVLRAGPTAVTVLGTIFSVTYRVDNLQRDQVAVQVSEGRVRVRHEAREVLLGSGEYRLFDSVGRAERVYRGRLLRFETGDHLVVSDLRGRNQRQFDLHAAVAIETADARPWQDSLRPGAVVKLHIDDAHRVVAIRVLEPQQPVTLLGVDLAQNVLRYAVPQASVPPQSARLSADARIRIDGRTAALSELQAGRSIWLTWASDWSEVSEIRVASSRSHGD